MQIKCHFIYHSVKTIKFLNVTKIHTVCCKTRTFIYWYLVSKISYIYIKWHHKTRLWKSIIKDHDIFWRRGLERSLYDTEVKRIRFILFDHKNDSTSYICEMPPILVTVYGDLLVAACPWFLMIVLNVL